MKSACFTGHRKITNDMKALEIRLYDTLEYYIKNCGLTDFYAGGAVGWDTLSALTVLRLREVYPHIRLHLVLPCSNEEQTKKWTPEQKSVFYDILARVDSAEYTSQSYYRGCMRKRNQKLVEYADVCFCYFNPQKKFSSTCQTVNMAGRKFIYKKIFSDFLLTIQQI
ncbi:MAG: DUF1273 domain-containing protein [Ruminococcus flavefaciens]|nr:DUF1273 domain-containing protein [Ruminococcus flavefaciens]MCM1228557.1 DUF1273 domain-containing protein [Ruminococcus flavefaciens]